MESIVKVLSDPGAWVSGILFGLITALIVKIFRVLPATARNFSLGQRVRRLKKIRTQRRDALLVTYAMGQASANYVLFILLSFVYIYAIIFLAPLREIIEKSTLAGMLLAMPTFAFEVAWLYSDSFAKDLIKARRKLLRSFGNS